MQRLCKKQLKSAIALAAAFALTVSGTAIDVNAASKNAPTLSKTKLSLKKGAQKQVTVKAKKSVKIKKTTWSVKKGAGVVKLSKKTKTKVNIKAVKKGTATVQAKIKTAGKTYTKTVKVTVTANTTPKKTTAPVKTDKPSPTNNPSVDKTEAPSITDAPVVDNTDAPTITDAPSVSDEPTVTDAPIATSKPTATPKRQWATNQPDPTPAPDEDGGTLAEKTSWNKGTICSLPGTYAGKKVKITLQVKIKGAEVSSGELKFVANYNGYPTMATIPLSNEWTEVEIEHRFNDFTNQYSVLYVDSNEMTSDMFVFYKDLNFEVLDEGDPLGGTSLTPASWHKGQLASLRDSNLNGAEPNKAYEDKQVRIRFQVRAKGEIPEGGTCYIKANGITPATVIEDIPLTTDWTPVEGTVTFGKVSDGWPGLFFDGTDITSEMEMFIKDVSLEIIGSAPTPGPTATPEPGAPVEENLVLQGSSLSAGADFTYEANGAAQYTEVARLALSGDKFTSNPTLLLEWTAKDAENNDITSSTKFNITIRKDNPGWQADGANDMTAAYEKITTHSLQLGADKVGDLTSDNTVYVIIATSTAGFNGTYTLTKASLDGTEETNLPASYTYQENGMAQYAPTAQVNLPSDIVFSKYKTCEIEYEVNDSTGVALQAIVGAKNASNTDVSDPNYSESRDTGKFVITLNKLLTLENFTAPYLKLQTANAGFTGSVKIKKITFVLKDA